MISIQRIASLVALQEWAPVAAQCKCKHPKIITSVQTDKSLKNKSLMIQCNKMLLQNVKNIFPISLSLLHFLHQICRSLFICLVGIPVKYIYEHIQVKPVFLSPLLYNTRFYILPHTTSTILFHETHFFTISHSHINL